MALIFSSSDPAIEIVDGYNILAERDGNATFITSASIQTKKNAISNKDDLENHKTDINKYPTVGAMIDYYLDHQATGPRGYQGFQGQQGTQGHQGERGYQGFQGESGSSGGSGSQGPQGPQGPQGKKGDTGAQGPQGTPGKTGSDYWVTNKTSCSGSNNLGADYNIYGVAFFQGSDIRKKNDIEEIKGALENISKIPTIRFRYKGSEQLHLGTVAQDIEHFIPEVVRTDEESEEHFKSVTYPELAVYGIAALKELVEILKTKKIL